MVFVPSFLLSPPTHMVTMGATILFNAMLLSWDSLWDQKWATDKVEPNRILLWNVWGERYSVMRHRKPVWEEEEGEKGLATHKWVSSFLQLFLRSLILCVAQRSCKTFKYSSSSFSPLFTYLNALRLDLCRLQQTALMTILTGSHLLCVQ